MRATKQTITFRCYQTFRNRLAVFLLFCIAFSCGKKEENSTEKPKTSFDPSRVSAIGRIEPAEKIIPLSAEVSGVVKQVLVKAGDSVKAGQKLLEMTTETEAAQVQNDQTTIATRQAEIRASQAEFTSAKTKAANAQQQYQRLQNAYDQGAESRQNVDNARTEAQTAQNEAERLQAQLNVKRQEVANAVQKRDLSKLALEKRYVKAPENGLVLTMDLTPGSAVTAFTPLADFAPAGPVTALCEVDELFADRVKVGQKALIRHQGMNDTLAFGKVIFAAPYLKKKSLFSDAGGDLEDRRVREVRIQAENGQDMIFGMRVECVIFTK
ncbi:efflux RND transporter periplasmic adaptor subunit [Adhaeribacter sp. BT258]|uniref:Efflux RND transporter periplasmic adaptor subunit n=1 Tax=Adhaeribacter terrigena TaxID=2793070 RepID=A0ABS1BYU0_9BACT|nr:efflux RND transporter periplasmic adaptor subunit [Adhaeribacter terrigena]MBK0401553.1 efflux RND transporter periplasmic adaptor subunit [Adhaeribacter terrigena]